MTDLSAMARATEAGERLTYGSFELHRVWRQVHGDTVSISTASRYEKTEARARAAVDDWIEATPLRNGETIELREHLDVYINQPDAFRLLGTWPAPPQVERDLAIAGLLQLTRQLVELEASAHLWVGEFTAKAKAALQRIDGPDSGHRPAGVYLVQVCRMAIKVGLQRPHDGNQLDADLEELLICAREALAKVDAPLVPPHGGTHPMSDHVPLTEAVYQHMREEIFHGGFVGSVAMLAVIDDVVAARAEAAASQAMVDVLTDERARLLEAAHRAEPVLDALRRWLTVDPHHDGGPGHDREFNAALRALDDVDQLWLEGKPTSALVPSPTSITIDAPLLLCGSCENKPATCFGLYEDLHEDSGDGPTTSGGPSCDDCCGHGNEDGHCAPLASVACEECKSDMAIRIRRLAGAISAAPKLLAAAKRALSASTERERDQADTDLRLAIEEAEPRP